MTHSHININKEGLLNTLDLIAVGCDVWVSTLTIFLTYVESQGNEP